MRTNDFGEIVLDDNDICDLIMQGKSLSDFKHIMVDPTVQTDNIEKISSDPISFAAPSPDNMPVDQYDEECQKKWFMPTEYYDLDIAEYVLSLCTSQEELQRCGKELLLYQEKDLFGLLAYLKFLVDTMTENGIIWGVGRGSSVSSYVLYKLGVHKIDSMYYDLNPEDFLR